MHVSATLPTHGHQMSRKLAPARLLFLPGLPQHRSAIQAQSCSCVSMAGVTVSRAIDCNRGGGQRGKERTGMLVVASV